MKYFTILLITLPVLIFAQGYDNTMVFGYAGGSLSPNDDGFGLNILTFPDGNLHLSDNQVGEAEFNDTNATISDPDGNLLFYFNGIDLYNKSHQVMENGDTLNNNGGFGYDLPQGAIILPFPTKPNYYILFHSQEGYIPPWGNAVIGLYYSIVDIQANDGLGKVVSRKKTLMIDSLEYGKLAVVRHANGRDWWLTIGESWKNTFYIFLIHPKGITLKTKQIVGTNRIEGIGQAMFSPDGTKYVSNSGVSALGLTNYADIYDFDRCTGLFSNHEHIQLFENVFMGGIVISPNSRWAYLNLTNWVYQYDLWSTPVADSKILIATYEEFLDPFPTKFSRSFLAPDNKIYIVTTSGSRTLHVMHDPDEQGAGCNFQQHGIRLKCHNANSLPTSANYRLGPLDGSGCDTLGINNDPVAWYRYKQDTLNPNHITFHDLSYHEPSTWSWNFGDGNTSTERHPSHVYALPGVYEACLTVSNVNGTHTHCKTIYGVTAAENPVLQAQIQVTPNPFRERFSVALSAELRSPVIRLFDQLGQEVLSQRIAYGITAIEAGSLAAGIYFYVVESGGERISSGKIIVKH